MILHPTTITAAERTTALREGVAAIVPKTISCVDLLDAIRAHRRKVA